MDYRERGSATSAGGLSHPRCLIGPAKAGARDGERQTRRRSAAPGRSASFGAQGWMVRVNCWVACWPV